MTWTFRRPCSSSIPLSFAIGAWLCMLLAPFHAAIAGTVDRDAMIDRGLSAEARGDYVAALKVWEQLAHQGDDKAMTNAGVIYQNGTGVTADYEKALDWYLKSVNGDALNNMGVMYRDGTGVPQNRKIAYLLFLAVHMDGMGYEETIMRANRNLRRELAELPQEDTDEALCYTMGYLKAYIESRGKLVGIPPKLRASARRPRIKELGWWSKDEIAPYACPAGT